MSAARRALGVAVVVLFGAGGARAATFIVDSRLDTIDASPGDGVCADWQGRCTLRAAILETNALPGADGIFFKITGTPYFLAQPGDGEDLGYEGDLDITGDLSIVYNLRSEGPPQRPVIDGMELDRVFDVRPGAKVSIQGLIVTHGHVMEGGGGIRNEGTLTLVQTVVHANFALYGGGIDNQGTLEMTDTSLIANVSVLMGGGICNCGIGQSHLEAYRSVISHNQTAGEGGGLFHGGTGWLVNTTVSGNSAGYGDVGIVFASFGISLGLDNSTVTDHGIGIKAAGWIDPQTREPNSGAVWLRNTIVAKNSHDCWIGEAGLILSFGHNLDSDDTCNLGLPSDQPAVDPIMGPLAGSGGHTATHALLPGSPAIDAGNKASCPPTDQRGFARPQGAGCDIGAYEYGAWMPAGSPSR